MWCTSPLWTTAKLLETFWNSQVHRAMANGEFLCCQLYFPHTGITAAHNWLQPHNPPHPLSPGTASLLMAIRCRDNHGGTQLTIWWADPCFDSRSIPADTHRHAHTRDRALWQGNTDPDLLWHTHTDQGTHSHTEIVFVHFSPSRHRTVQVDISRSCRVRRLSCFMIGLCLLQHCVHWCRLL